MKNRRNLTSQDWLLLSAYLDNQLSEIEKRQVDERLQADPECRQALEALRRTSMLLRSLPVRRVPRNFTLSAQSAPKKLIPIVCRCAALFFCGSSASSDGSVRT